VHDRIRWHCRRGMLEIDLVLNAFLDRHLETLTERQLDAFRALLEARAVDVVILDLARVGGITPWRRIAALAHAHRVPVCGHVVPEIQVHLLAAVPGGHMVEYVPRSADMLVAMPRVERGELVAPSGPGLGLQLDEAAIRRHRVG